ncbi:isochorismatase family protein [Luteimonas sp. 100069]|uniref:isochorismatase family protein n=1 Tax=Luteimonas sp. 100069 TaxID=2006109 RepID=UPI000F4F70F2|nr:isochorismatase family protein [Luteimonas sp. 100069]RPD88560.1 isochorismatase family protein [Luteimonas sp. 100069]
MSKDDTLLTPDNHALIMIDHQYLQLLSVRSHTVEEVVSNAVITARTAKIFDVPTLFTTAFAERQELIKEIQAIDPEQVPIDRTGLNSWDDQRVVDWVEATGKKKLVMAGLWTEVCLAMPVLSSLAAGYEVYIVTDASGGSSPEAHERAVQRMIQAGTRPITSLAYLSELQRDWKYESTATDVVNLAVEMGTASGHGLRWVWQLQGLKEGTR